MPIFAGSESFAPELSPEDCLAAVREAARAVGYPVILKLNAGGGGKGMEIVHEPSELPAAVESVRRVGRSNYSDATFYLERYIVEPVHIEVQIFNAAAIGIRKCAVQRRNQKVIEESGESLLSADQVQALFAAAERMAAASGYADDRAGAGTVEFLYDAARESFGFLEMNTRLQVEYAVTDLSRNVDLVAWQIQNFDRPDFQVPTRLSLNSRNDSADGAPTAISDDASRPAPIAHAIQCRLYAEDAFRDYAPAPGRIAGMQLPAFDGVRCDFGFQEGDEIVGRYDPMIGKLLAWGPDRATALARLERALGELYIQGLTTNLDQLLRIVRHPAFRSGEYDNRLLDLYAELHDVGAGPDADLRVEAAIFGCAMYARRAAAEIYADFFGARERTPDLRELMEDPRLLNLPSRFRTEIGGEQLRVELVQVAGGSYYVFVGDRYAGVLHLQSPAGDADARTLRVRFGGRGYRLRTEHRAGVTQVRCTEAGGRVNYFRMRIESMNGGGPEPDPAGMVRAPFRGSFVALGAPEAKQSPGTTEASGADAALTKDRPAAAIVLQPGDRVREGQPVITLSAMKMETRVFAPCDGVLSFLIEEGDLDRLIMGRTPEGLVQGKSIAEGDVLFVVSPDRIETPAGNEAHNADPGDPPAASGEDHIPSRNLLDHLHRDTLLRVFDSTSRNHIRIILGLARAALLGWVRDRSIIENIMRVLESPGEESFQSDSMLRKETENVLRSFLYIRRAFSPEGASSLLQFHEIHRLFEGRSRSNSGGSSPDEKNAARYSVTATFDHFGRECGYETPVSAGHRKAVLFEMLRMYRAGSQHAALLLPLISRWSRATPEAAARPLLNRLLQTVTKESRHLRNARLEERLRQVLQEFQGRVPRFRETDPVYSRNHLGAYRSFIEEPLLLLTDYRSTTAGRREELRAALAPGAGLDTPLGDPLALPDWIPEGVAGAISEKIDALSARYDIALVPFDCGGSLALLRLIDRADSNECGYVCVAWPHEGRMIAEVDPARDDCIVGAPNIENCVARAAAMLTACQRELDGPDFAQWRRADLHIWYRLEILACTNTSPMDLTTRDPRVWNRRNLKDLASKLMLFFTRLELRLLSLDVDALHPASGARRRLHVSFYMRSGQLRVALLVPEDPRHPYHRPGPVEVSDPRNARLFAKGKWPAEIWAREAFDPGSVGEIRIESIDGPADAPAMVGARLYRGTLSGRPAWFFLKDSRRNGGATGDREGRKFVAAAYLAYMTNAPLYVWNDGAGANIKEGMVALNRAAQGFMMNALLAGAVSYRKFSDYTRRQADPALAELFQEIDRSFQLADISRRAGRPDNVFLVAIGVGSSTGLDVYGSSQASVQVLLDSEQSYRVLTGSSVIRSVTGEDLTNYEIGGARVMGAETGTADLIAVDRLDLLARVRHVHEVFSHSIEGASPPTPVTPSVPRRSSPESVAAGVIFNEDLLQAVSDDGDWLPMKSEYSGGESLLGGFLRLGGAGTLVLGPRTEFGTTTEA
ncbi:MAG: carboxyl transferase domain-containing protein, partial [Leptospirales bacterium]